MRRAFTLVELLVIIAIMGLMVTAGILNVRSSQGAVRVKGAARDILAQIRRARSVALITRVPSHLTYSEKTIDDEVCAVVEVEVGNFISAHPVHEAVTLAGDRVVIAGGKVMSAEDADAAKDSEEDSPIASLFAKGIDPEVAKGIRIKVVRGDDELLLDKSDEQRRSSISASAFVDGQKTLEIKEEMLSETSVGTVADERQAPERIRWEANGRVEPHRVYVYADGAKPDEGLVVNVDRFGAIKVLSGGGEEEED